MIANILLTFCVKIGVDICLAAGVMSNFKKTFVTLFYSHGGYKRMAPYSNRIRVFLILTKFIRSLFMGYNYTIQIYISQD